MDWAGLAKLGARIGLTPGEIRGMFDVLATIALKRPVLSIVKFDEWREQKTGELDQSVAEFLGQHYTPEEVAFWRRAFGIEEDWK